MLEANGLTLPLDQWALRLKISEFAITHAISEGLRMQDVVDAYTSDYYVAPQAAEERPVTPPPRPITPMGKGGTPGGPVLQSPNGGFTFRSLCVQCAEQAKNYYDLAHSAHREQQRLERRAAERAWNDQMFSFVNLGGQPGPSA